MDEHVTASALWNMLWRDEVATNSGALSMTVLYVGDDLKKAART